MATGNNNQWEIGIGDPSIYGWVTVANYAMSAYLCWKTCSVGAGHDRQAWFSVMGILVALGINKQLDIQSLFTQEARIFLSGIGLYGVRRSLQVVFIFLLISSAIAGVLIFWRKFAQLNVHIKIALCGLCFVLCYVLVRAASFHHFDLLLPLETLGLPFNFLFENLGIVAISSAAIGRKNAIWRHLQLLKNGVRRSHY